MNLQRNRTPFGSGPALSVCWLLFVIDHSWSNGFGTILLSLTQAESVAVWVETKNYAIQEPSRQDCFSRHSTPILAFFFLSVFSPCLLTLLRCRTALLRTGAVQTYSDVPFEGNWLSTMRWWGHLIVVQI